MAVTTKNAVFWNVTPCGSCKNTELTYNFTLLTAFDIQLLQTEPYTDKANNPKRYRFMNTQMASNKTLAIRQFLYFLTMNSFEKP
jgi:hypothetical protein